MSDKPSADVRETHTERLSNHEIVTIALLLEGGAISAVDTEDVAIRANGIAPGRFTWRKYPDQINLELVRVFLSDAKKPGNGAYVGGSGRQGWRLTASGRTFAESQTDYLDLVEGSRSTPRIAADVRRKIRIEEARLRATDAYNIVISDGLKAVTRQQAESFFRIDDYVTDDARSRKIERIRTMFATDKGMIDIIDALAEKVRHQ